MDVNGKTHVLPWNPVRGGEWYAAAIKTGLREAGGLSTRRNAKNVSGKSVLRVMRVYADFDWGGSDVMLSQERIGEKAGLSAYTVRRAQQWLIENGWLILAGRFKKKQHGWKVLLTIPDDEYNPATMFSWENIHPKRLHAWLSEEDWIKLRLVIK